jgi:hypothetical protein
MITVSTDRLPAGERFGFWHEVSSRTWVPYELSCEPHLENGFQARMDVRDLGALQVALMTTTPDVIHRTAKLIRRDDPGLCKLGIAVHGAGTTSQDGREAAFGVGDLVLYDTSRPYSAALSQEVPETRLLVLRFPRLDPRATPGALPPRPGRTAARRPSDQCGRGPVGILQPRIFHPGVPQRLRRVPTPVQGGAVRRRTPRSARSLKSRALTGKDIDPAFAQS